MDGRVRICRVGIQPLQKLTMNQTIAVLLPILLSEPTNLVWVGNSDGDACANMISGQYCTCGAAKEPDEFVCRSVFRPSAYDNASCLNGTIARWTQQHIFWRERGFVCMPPPSPSPPPPSIPPPPPIFSMMHCIWDRVRGTWSY